MNIVVLKGRLTRDPELKFLSSGSAVCNLGLALNKKYKKDGELVEKVTFVDIDVWGKSGENCAEYLSKGREVCIEGELQMDEWEHEGFKKNKLKVVARLVHFVGSNQIKEGV